jgi:predicted LPLAT superfamily acyltransferase
MLSDPVKPVGARAKTAGVAHEDPNWLRTQERGTMPMLRLMTFISLRLGRRAARVVLHGIAAYFFLFAPAARRHMRGYLRRALQREPTPLDRYRLLLSFASTIHDRVYLLQGRDDLFEISIEGAEAVIPRLDRGEGILFLGAHLGSFEIIRAAARHCPGLHVAMAMYEDNARKINAMIRAVNPGLAPEIIPLGTLDSMLRIQARLAEGACVGVLADRTIGAEPLQRVCFLGDPAHFPTSPMRLAAILRRPVSLMVGLYRGANRYHVAFEELTDFSGMDRHGRDAAVRAAVERYAALLERRCRSDPYNWFNFFDFWQDPAARKAVGTP